MTKQSLYQGNIGIKKSPIHNYGIFALQDFNVGDVIEECYALLTTNNDPYFSDYVFALPDNRTVLPLGFGAMYNHAENFNARYEFDEQQSLLIISAHTAIKTGEEIFIYYGRGWFSDRKTKPKKLSLAFRMRRFLKLMLRFLLVLFMLVFLVTLMRGIVPFKFF